MLQRIKIHTDFDITNTGVVRNFREGMQLPRKIHGRLIETEEEWIICRRQQTNWETILQIISLRTQPLNMKTNVNATDWTFEFDVEFADIYRRDKDPLGILKEDFNNVPMLIGLGEHKKLENFIVTEGNNKNMRFEIYEI